jgi:hypothetical protein
MACSDVENPGSSGVNENELITEVVLTASPQTGGADVVARWADPEGDGAPTIDPLSLDAGETYAVSVAFFNGLEDPPEDISAEIAQEDDEHQIFWTGPGVESPATGPNPAALVSQAYADADAGGLPVGLDSTVVVLGAGVSEVVITLRHLPPESGNPTKVAGLAETVAAEGFAAIGGDTDAEVTFPLTVP